VLRYLCLPPLLSGRDILFSSCQSVNKSFVCTTSLLVLQRLHFKGNFLRHFACLLITHNYGELHIVMTAWSNHFWRSYCPSRLTTISSKCLYMQLLHLEFLKTLCMPANYRMGNCIYLQQLDWTIFKGVIALIYL